MQGTDAPQAGSGQPSAAPGNAAALEDSPDADAQEAATVAALPGWQHVPFPGKTATQFQMVQHAGRSDVVAAYAASSASMLRRKLRVAPGDLDQITFSWMVPQLNTVADMSLRDKDDAVVRVVLAFEGDRSRLSLKDQMLSELALTLTGEEMPYATLMYVWCNRNQVGHIIHSPRTGRIRSMVVEHGPAHLNQWLDYKRDIRADYAAAFGEPPGALIGVGIMTDTDNTRTRSRSWYGAVELTSKND
ncbi:DUF3047 domain-containing protein [Variovorax sp. HJSM1_2]|uniref:DUF3047 domain-containing protein n=1 Tax=Variovorax sp. HJSM1_2 TaxID=3366263 RepID=UPI003BC9A53E